MGFNPLITVLNFEKKSTSKSKQELQPFFFAKNAIFVKLIFKFFKFLYFGFLFGYEI